MDLLLKIIHTDFVDPTDLSSASPQWDQNFNKIAALVHGKIAYKKSLDLNEMFPIHGHQRMNLNICGFFWWFPDRPLVHSVPKISKHIEQIVICYWAHPRSPDHESIQIHPQIEMWVPFSLLCISQSPQFKLLTICAQFLLLWIKGFLWSLTCLRAVIGSLRLVAENTVNCSHTSLKSPQSGTK